MIARDRLSRRWLLSALSLPLVLAACAPQTTVTTGDTAQPRVVSLSATGQAEAVPDAARASLTVTVTDPTSATTAQSQAAEATSKVLDALAQAGVDKADIATQALSVGPVYNYTQQGGQEQIGYQATQQIQVTLHDLTTAGATIDAVVTAGGNAVRVDSLSTYVSDPTVAATKARAQAVQIAQKQAQEYADLLGFTLGPVASVSESSAVAPPPVAMADAAGATAEKVTTPIEPGTQQVSVTLSVSWSIEDK